MSNTDDQYFRDAFAAQALHLVGRGYDSATPSDIVASAAYRMAEAMMIERAKYHVPPVPPTRHAALEALYKLKHHHRGDVFYKECKTIERALWP